MITIPCNDVRLELEENERGKSVLTTGLILSKNQKLMRCRYISFDEFANDFICEVAFDGFASQVMLDEVYVVLANKESLTNVLKDMLIPREQEPVMEYYIKLEGIEVPYEITTLNQLLEIGEDYNLSVQEHSIEKFALQGNLGGLVSNLMNENGNNLGSVIQCIEWAFNKISTRVDISGKESEEVIDAINDLLSIVDYSFYTITEGAIYVGEVNESDNDALYSFCYEHVENIRDFIDYMDLYDFANGYDISTDSVYMFNRTIYVVYQA